ncbi:hypothetical protein FSP39_001598 [Pinctada imbricata]|uniref:Uncharacterized protein n=1 Tax=Pinctada imbricata TaxID=66713 RepID=A0AA88YT03_PINIB|nr:hypothetical protein FSP39_001598 [Pinctada imbricata]
MIIDHSRLFNNSEGFRNLSRAGLPQKKVVGVISAASLGFSILKGIAENVDYSRTCVIGIANFGNRKLINPTWYLNHGVIKDPLPRYLLPGKAAVLTFEKTSYAITGSNGVLTYEVDGTQDQVVVMWDVPFNYLLNSNEFNVQILANVKANKNLFLQMTVHEDKLTVSNSGHWLSKYRDNIAVHGAMTNNAKASLLVQVEFNLTSNYETHQIFG